MWYVSVYLCMRECFSNNRKLRAIIIIRHHIWVWWDIMWHSFCLRVFAVDVVVVVVVQKYTVHHFYSLLGDITCYPYPIGWTKLFTLTMYDFSHWPEYTYSAYNFLYLCHHCDRECVNVYWLGVHARITVSSSNECIVCTSTGVWDTTAISYTLRCCGGGKKSHLYG